MEEEHQFYICFAIAIVFLEALPSKIVKASDVRIFSDYIICQDHFKFNYMLLSMNVTEIKIKFRGSASESSEKYPVHHFCLHFVSFDIES